MSMTSTYLIEKNAVFREGLKTVLDGTAFTIRKTLPDIKVMVHERKHAPASSAGKMTRDAPAKRNKRDADLVIVGLNEDIKNGIDAVEKKLQSIRRIFPRSRLAVISDYADPSCIRASFRAGIDGYMLSDISPRALTAALSMIMAGEKVCPAPVLEVLVNPQKNAGPFYDSEQSRAEVSSYDLSRREMEVLRYLTVGQSNKEIARALDVTEATIKVHVKSLLRKLDLSNRTQAAVWAVVRGVRNQEQGSHGKAEAA